MFMAYSESANKPNINDADGIWKFYILSFWCMHENKNKYKENKDISP